METQMKADKFWTDELIGPPIVMGAAAERALHLRTQRVLGLPLTNKEAAILCILDQPFVGLRARPLT